MTKKSGNDPELEKIMKEKAEKMARPPSRGEIRAKGRGSVGPPVPPKVVKAADIPTVFMQELQGVQQQLNNLTQTFNQFSRQTTQQINGAYSMLNMLSRPDLALDQVLKAFRNGYDRTMIACISGDFKLIIGGTVETENPEWIQMLTENGIVSIRQDIVILRYEKTEEMVKADIERKAEEELRVREAEKKIKEAEEKKKKEIEKVGKEKGHVSRDSKTTTQPTKKSSDKSKNTPVEPKSD